MDRKFESDLLYAGRFASGWRVNQGRAQPLFHLDTQYGAFTELLPALVRHALSTR